MTTQDSDCTAVDSVSFIPSFEAVHGILVELQVYVFDKDGELLARQSVRKGRAVFPLGPQIRRCAHVVLAPPVDDLIRGPITLPQIRAFHAFEPKCDLGSGLKVHFLPEVPESVWRWWLVHSLWKALDTGANLQPAAVVF